MKLLFIFLLSTNLYAIELENLKGEKVNFDTKNKKALVMFWGSWCGECKDKLKTVLPEINKRDQIGVYTVNMDKNPKRAQHIIRKLNIKLPVLKDNNKSLVKA